MKKTGLFACVAVLALSSVSFAELAKVGSPNGVSVVNITGVTAAASAVNDANLGNIDQVTGLTLTGGANGGVATVDFQLNSALFVQAGPPGPRGETTFLLFATSSSGASLTGLSIGTGVGAGYTNIATSSVVPNLALVAGRNVFVGTYSGGAIPTYTTFRAVFTLGVGSSISIDMVSNPEPGTMALFAFGLVGMGALAWRRRSIAKLAAVKATK